MKEYYLLQRLKTARNAVIVATFWTIYGAVILAFWDKLKIYTAAIPHSLLSVLLLIALPLLLFLIPYSTLLKISSLKDEKFMIQHIGETRKQDNLSAKRFEKSKAETIKKKMQNG